jgi:hypothetical protein
MALHASWNASGVNGFFAFLLLGHIVFFLIVVRRLRRIVTARVALGL